MLPAVAVNDEGGESRSSGGPVGVVAWFRGAESKGLADPAQLFQRYITAMSRNAGSDCFRDIRGKGTSRTSSEIRAVQFVAAGPVPPTTVCPSLMSRGP